MSGRREEILDTALALADERGLEAVSMRALADRLGVTPMALYRHVDSKAALLDGLVGRLLAAFLPRTPASTGAGTPGSPTSRTPAEKPSRSTPGQHNCCSPDPPSPRTPYAQ